DSRSRISVDIRNILCSRANMRRALPLILRLLRNYANLNPHSFPTRRSSDLQDRPDAIEAASLKGAIVFQDVSFDYGDGKDVIARSEEHTSELQSLAYLVCRLLLEKKKATQQQLYNC